MELRHLKLERDGGTLICRIDNYPSQTFTSRMVAELHTLLDDLERDETLRVLVVTGTEEVFIRWFELTELMSRAEGVKDIGSPEAAEALGRAQEALEIAAATPSLIGALHRLGMRIERLPAVTIAAINGHVGGGGCEFSLSFDFRLMRDMPGATFALPQSSFSIVPGGGGAWHCVRLLGRAKALDVLLHGEFMPPAKALELGLISRLFPNETYWEDVQAFAANLAARAPLALRGVKELVRYGTEAGQIEFYVKEAQVLGSVITSEDTKHALGMWLANPDPAAYKPQFKGR